MRILLVEDEAEMAAALSQALKGYDMVVDHVPTLAEAEEAADEGRVDLSRVHMVGIGGAGMSGLAHILLARGSAVSGSDPATGETIDAGDAGNPWSGEGKDGL